jgi:hypothetical protein
VFPRRSSVTTPPSSEKYIFGPPSNTAGKSTALHKAHTPSVCCRPPRIPTKIQHHHQTIKWGKYIFGPPSNTAGRSATLLEAHTPSVRCCPSQCSLEGPESPSPGGGLCSLMQSLPKLPISHHILWRWRGWKEVRVHMCTTCRPDRRHMVTMRLIT